MKISLGLSDKRFLVLPENLNTALHFSLMFQVKYVPYIFLFIGYSYTKLNIVAFNINQVKWASGGQNFLNKMKIWYTLDDLHSANNDANESSRSAKYGLLRIIFHPRQWASLAFPWSKFASFKWPSIEWWIMFKGIRIP